MGFLGVCIDGIRDVLVNTYTDKSIYEIPSASWIRKHIPNDVSCIHDDFTKLTRKTINALRRTGFLKRPLIIAIDATLKPRYDKSGYEYLKRSRYKSSTTRFETYATAQCVVNNLRLHLGAFPVYAFDSIGDFVPRLIRQIKRYHVIIDTILLDREFYSAKVMKSLTHNHVHYVIPCVNRGTVKRVLDEYEKSLRKSVSRHQIIDMFGTVEEFTMIIVPRTSYKGLDDDVEPYRRYIGFATNHSLQYV